MRAMPRENGGPRAPVDGDGARADGSPGSGQITIQDAIRLTARFEREWFRSPRTLDEDLARFAAACRLGVEEVEQVRRVMTALGEEIPADDARDP